MCDYISRETILKELDNTIDKCKEVPITNVDVADVCSAIMVFIDNMQAADVQPVRRAQWIWDSSPEFGNPYGSYTCSECKERQAFKENYCPNCGARMDGEN